MFFGGYTDEVKSMGKAEERDSETKARFAIIDSIDTAFLTAGQEYFELHSSLCNALLYAYTQLKWN